MLEWFRNLADANGYISQSWFLLIYGWIMRCRSQLCESVPAILPFLPRSSPKIAISHAPSWYASCCSIMRKGFYSGENKLAGK